MAASSNENRDRLAYRLRALRAASWRSGNAFASAIGMGQSKVSKLETGRQLPSDDDLRVWTRHTDQSALDELRGLAAASRVEYASFGPLRGGRLADDQARIEQLESASTRIDEYLPSLVSGYVQTPEYARAVLALPPLRLAEADIEDTVAARMRRQKVIYSPKRRVRIVMGEAALRAAPSSVDVLRGQLRVLEVVATQGTIELGIVPFPAMPVPPVGGFRIYDGPTVYVESLTGEQPHRDHPEVDGFAAAFDALRASSATGDAAVALIRAALEALPQST